mgnify:FL=1
MQAKSPQTRSLGLCLYSQATALGGESSRVGRHPDLERTAVSGASPEEIPEGVPRLKASGAHPYRVSGKIFVQNWDAPDFLSLKLFCNRF